jgi:hypothetical protein
VRRLEVTLSRQARPLLAVLVGLAPFLASLRFGFTLDDANTIVGHKGVQERFSYDDLVLRDWWGRSRFDTIGTWRPFTTLTFWVDRHLGGGRPWLFHATNLVLYAALLVVFDRLLRHWGGPKSSPWAPLLGVLAFGTLAIHGDVVPSPTGRAEILAALFSLVAIYAVTCGATLATRHAVVACSCLLLAFLSKESAAPMAILLPLLAHRTHGPKSTAHRGAMLAVAIASPVELAAVAAFRALKMPFMQLTPERALENPLLAVDGPHRLAGALDVFSLYLEHLLTGAGLAPDYSFSEPPILQSAARAIFLGGTLAIALGGILLLCWRRAPRVADGILAFGASYLTVSNVIVAASAIADRLFFFPSMWLVASAVLLLDRVLRARAHRLVAAAIALGFVGTQLVRATAYASLWRDDLVLLGAAARVYPDVFRTQRNLAHALSDAHDDDGAAWHLVVAETIYARYPFPVARDAIDPAWDREPLDRRLEHLSHALSEQAVCGAARVAAARLRTWDSPGAAVPLDTWSKRECGEASVDAP